MMKIKYDSLGFMLNRASWTMSNKLRSNFKKYGIDLTLAQYTILRILFEQDGICQMHIAKSLFKDSASIKRNLDILEKKDLIERRPASLCKHSVHLTQAGWELKSTIINIAEQSIQEILKDIPEDMINTSIHFLEKIYTEP